jgi:hypothetical protein
LQFQFQFHFVTYRVQEGFITRSSESLGEGKRNERERQTRHTDGLRPRDRWRTTTVPVPAMQGSKQPLLQAAPREPEGDDGMSRHTTAQRAVERVRAMASGYYTAGKLAREISGAASDAETTVAARMVIQELVRAGVLLSYKDRPDRKRNTRRLYMGTGDVNALYVRATHAGDALAGNVRDRTGTDGPAPPSRSAGSQDPHADLFNRPARPNVRHSTSRRGLGAGDRLSQRPHVSEVADDFGPREPQVRVISL